VFFDPVACFFGVRRVRTFQNRYRYLLHVCNELCSSRLCILQSISLFFLIPSTRSHSLILHPTPDPHQPARPPTPLLKPYLTHLPLISNHPLTPLSHPPHLSHTYLSPLPSHTHPLTPTHHLTLTLTLTDHHRGADASPIPTRGGRARTGDH
jgi:hypothetical protein